MKNLLFTAFLMVILVSGCVGGGEIKYVDPENPDNYILMDTGSHSFTIVTTDFLAGGTYVETSEAYTLEYKEIPVGLTLHKVDGGAGVQVDKGVIWWQE